MNVIENFAALSFEEQMKFAEAIVKTINSESIFTDDTDFTISGVEADDLTGSLIINIEHDDLIEVPRKASWECGVADDVCDIPDDSNYINYADLIFNDAKKAFKTLEAEIKGYKVSLDVNDVDTEETVETQVDSYSREDAGIGSYEFWGHNGYDSQPYIEVEGIIVEGCNCVLSLYIEPAANHIVEPETEEV